MMGVSIWEERVVIPTYEAGEAEKNPMFLDKRVYQGSSGRIYPYPAVEYISDEIKDKEYKAVYLENEYIRIMVLPELGGRIQRAYDKTNDYDFVYYNHVIKPALVGLLGPWISGGIEFNWPQHHRPTTFRPVDYILQENEDGSKTLLVHDIDQMYGTEGTAGFTLYPGKAYIEVSGQLYNRTAVAQTFLWWANPAIPANDFTQSIFPPDVHAVMDHGKRDVSRFPMATGIYYKYDYSEGVDISRYKNILVPTSYMAEKSKYDFVGGYDHNLRAGILHVADHHISPGKKQWTWGCGDFGKAWDRNLTDEDGPYIELMTGVYTDNQPDFTWLQPFEEKTFTQYFMPYKAVGAVKNASIFAAVNLEQRGEGIYVCVYGTELYQNAKISVYQKELLISSETVCLSPVDIYEILLPVHVEHEAELRVEVTEGGRILVSYQPEEQKLETMPKPAEAAKDPKEIMTNEELYLTGLHIEQYRHATYLPDPYYLEGLRRDEKDMRINNAYGSLLLRRGLFSKAEQHFRKAVERMVWKNPNPYDGEPFYNLGLALLYQDRKEDAYDEFYKAAWSGGQQEMAYYYLACIDAGRGYFERALELVEKGLVKNIHNVRARGLKTYLLRKLERKAEALIWNQDNLKVSRFDFVSLAESVMLSDNKGEMEAAALSMSRIMRGFVHNYLQAARDYAQFGAFEEASEMLRRCGEDTPMLHYYEAYYLGQMERGGKETAAAICKRGDAACPDYCFPNKLEDICVLEAAIRVCPDGAMAYYYLGNLYYDKMQYDRAAGLWEESVRLNGSFPVAWRNLALCYYNKLGEKEKARTALETAFQLDQKDARLFLELDQLYKKLDMTFEDRLKCYEAYQEVIEKRDDLYIEYITLYNLLGRYEEASRLIAGHKFHPWEGGEGKITTQYTTAFIELARQAIKAGDALRGKEYLEKALRYPENLGEGKLAGTKDNDIYYYLGCAAEQLEGETAAKAYFEAALAGDGEPAGMMYYNDQPADMILFQGLAYLKLGRRAEANARFYRLIDYGENHMNDQPRIEYFAVSLPDFLIFEEDLNEKNKAHCHYLIGLGNLGLGNCEKAASEFNKALTYDKNHMWCIRYKKHL